MAPNLLNIAHIAGYGVALDGRLEISPHPYLKPFNMVILGCKVTLVDEATPFGVVAAGSLNIRGLVKKASARGTDLCDKETGAGWALPAWIFCNGSKF